jgi:hypothetical protein
MTKQDCRNQTCMSNTLGEAPPLSWDESAKPGRQRGADPS